MNSLLSLLFWETCFYLFLNQNTSLTSADNGLSLTNREEDIPQAWTNVNPPVKNRQHGGNPSVKLNFSEEI